MPMYMSRCHKIQHLKIIAFLFSVFGLAILDVQRANLDEVSQLHLYQENGKVLAI